MNRTPIESLFNVSLGIRKPFESELQSGFFDKTDLMIYNRSSGQILAMVSAKGLFFDANGNFFAESQD